MSASISNSGGTVSFELKESEIKLQDCSRYTNWFTRAITWFFGESVEVQCGTTTERVNIRDLAMKLARAPIIGEASIVHVPLLKPYPLYDKIKNDLKVLTQSCNKPLTGAILDVYATQLKKDKKNVSTDFVMTTVARKIVESTSPLSKEENDRSRQCVFSYADKHPEIQNVLLRTMGNKSA